VSRRPDRLSGEIREELSRLISRSLKDPRLGFVTVTRVELSTDLRHARVFVSVLGSEQERKESMKALHSAAGFLRREIGHRIRMRRVPELDIRYDQGLDNTQRVADLLREVGPADEEAPEATDPPDEE
jgi:ribosome-binding factor A